MNVIQYLESLDNFKDLTPQIAYSNFIDLGYTSTYGYFRTQFNKFKPCCTLEVENVILEETTNVEPDLEFSVSNYQDSDLEELKDSYIPTGTIYDEVTSIKSGDGTGGFVRKCVDMCYGKGGSGKTWSKNMLAAKAIELNPNIKACFISGEMRSSEYEREIILSPKLKNVDVLYLLKYFKPGIISGDQYLDLIRKTIELYDIIIIDSGTIIQKQLFRLYNSKYTAAELEFIFVTNLIDWVEKYNSNVQCLSQAIKSDNYAGSTLIPHMVSSLSCVRAEGQNRFLMFEKNRNNGATINQKLYFSKTAIGDIEFNEETYNATYKAVQDKKQSLADLFASLGKSSIEEHLESQDQDPTEMSVVELEEERVNLMED